MCTEAHGISLDDLLRHSQRLMLTLLRTKIHPDLPAAALPRYYPHHVGHHLGLDLHDLSALGADATRAPLRRGCVVTVEPGLYIPKGDPHFPPEYVSCLSM